VRNTFGDTEVEEVRKFVAIGRPVSGFTSGILLTRNISFKGETASFIA
jgi:hypothetical protein